MNGKRVSKYLREDWIKRSARVEVSYFTLFSAWQTASAIFLVHELFSRGVPDKSVECYNSKDIRLVNNFFNRLYCPGRCYAVGKHSRFHWETLF